MAQLLIHIDEDLAREIRRIVKDKYGGKKGALSLVVEDALRKAISPPAEISASTLLEVIDYVSRATREGQSKDQILTNVYLMLDREFEQSIIRGVEDIKSKRVHKVPKDKDSLQFLEILAGKI